MGKTDGSDTRRAITVSFTQAELDAMERFLEENPIMHSRSELARVAIKYYMRQVKESLGCFDSRTGFPLMAASDLPAQLALPEAIERRVGPFQCPIHGVIILKAATCQLCKAEAG